MSPRRVLLSVGSLCALLAAFLLSPVRADQSLYTDSLQNGWTNYSWATVNFSSASPVHGGANSISVQSSAYQALYLHHDAQASATLTALTFWINGGPTGGQRLQVQATLGGNPQPAYALPAPQANTWTQVIIPLSALGAAGQSSFDGVWIQDASGQSSVPVYFVDDISLTAGTQTAPGTTITIDAGANRHPISPLVYGVAYGDAQSLADLNAPLNRQGGNNTTRYNWQLNADNRASDYFFESIGDPSATPGERGDSFIAASKSSNTQAMLTIPTLGWVAKLGPNRAKLPSFSVSKYGAQQSTDPYLPDAGNGLRAGGATVTGNDPNDANVPADANFQAGWVSHLVSRWGTAAQGGLSYYILDNEPSIWFSTHRDVHPVGPTMDEIKGDILAYSAKIKAADPSASVVAPEEWGWSGYFSSGYDQQYGAAHGYQGHPDRDTHGGMDYLPWLLDQIHQNDLTTGKRSLDVFSVHFYPQAGEFSEAADQATVLLRNRSTRQLWDPNYVSESWINDKVMLIPRLKNWVNTYYPGTKTAITEYNWGAETSMSGATTQADIFGIFGREGLDLATRWTTPATSTPTYLAMKLYRNYDGAKSGFGDVSVSDTAPNPDTVSSFAAVRSSDDALTVTIINKSPSASAPATVSLTNFTPGASAQAWQLTSANAITRLADVPITGSALTATLPAQSVTLFVIPAVPSASPPSAPTDLTAQAGSTQVSLAWTASTGATSYSLYRSTASGSETLLQSGLTAVRYTDTGLTAGTTYFYQVAAVNAAGTSAKSAEVAATPVAFTSLINDTAPGVIYTGSWNSLGYRGAGDYQDDVHYTTINGDSVSYTFSGTGVGYVTETCSDEGNVDVYLDGVFQATVSCVSAVRRAQQTVWSVTGLSSGSHTLRLVKRDGPYMLLDAISIVSAPSMPTNLRATPSNAQVTLTWTASVGATSYSLYRSTTGGSETLLQSGLTAVRYTDTGLTAGTTYFYQVAAVNAAGTSAKSAEVAATPVAFTSLINDTAPGVIYTGSWNSLGYRGAGDYQDDVHYTTINGDSVSYTFSGTGVGYVTETCSDEGNVDVYLDGVFQATVSCVSAVRRAQQTVWSVTGLSSGSHTLRLVKRDGPYMLLDAVSVVPIGQ